MEYYAWSLTMNDAAGGEVEILQGLLTQPNLVGFLLAVGRMRDYLPGLNVRLNGCSIDHIEFKGTDAIIRASGGGP